MRWLFQHLAHSVCRSFSLVISTLVLFPSVYAINISGDIGGTTFTAESGPYIVDGICKIPRGKTTVIEKGCRFFFKPFTEINVNGNLTVAGTLDQPVIFTSFNDSLNPERENQPPDAFDWNGILVSKESGTVLLKNFYFRFSTYGIKSQNPNIKIEHGQFQQNGQFHFTINGISKNVTENIPFFYTTNTVTYHPNGATSGKPPVDLSHYGEGATVTVAGNTERLERKGYEFSGWNVSADGSQKTYQPGDTVIMGNAGLTLHAQWRRSELLTVEGGKKPLVQKGAPAGIAIAGAAAGAGSLYYLNRWLQYGDEYRTASDPERRSELRKEGIRTSAIAITACAGSVAALSTAATLYWQWNMRSKRKLAAAMFPIATPGGAGIALSVMLR